MKFYIVFLLVLLVSCSSSYTDCKRDCINQRKVMDNCGTGMKVGDIADIHPCANITQYENDCFEMCR